MTNLTYAVLRCGHEWNVVGPRGRISSCESMEAAIAFGLRLSRQARLEGLAVELLIHNNVGQLMSFSEWADTTFDDGASAVIPAFLASGAAPPRLASAHV